MAECGNLEQALTVLAWIGSGLLVVLIGWIVLLGWMLRPMLGRRRD